MSQPFDRAPRAAALLDAAKAGDWRRVASLTAELSRSAPPATREGLADYLARLREALIAARISRSHLAATLRRINAAAGFHAAAKQDAR